VRLVRARGTPPQPMATEARVNDRGEYRGGSAAAALAFVVVKVLLILAAVVLGSAALATATVAGCGGKR